MHCLGVTVKTGDYEGKPYANAMIHCSLSNSERPTRGEFHGDIVETLKVPVRVLSESGIQVDKLVGSKVYPRYDKFGRIIQLDLGVK